MTHFGTGHLSVMPLCAKLAYEGDQPMFVEPYVKCIIGNTSYMTRPYSGPYCSKNPTWNETLNFKIGGEGFATIIVYDKRNHCDDDNQNYIGEAHLQLHEIYTKGIFSNWYALTKNCQQLTGQIMIQFSYTSEKDRQKEKIQMSINKHMNVNIAGIDGMNKQIIPSVLNPNAPSLQQNNMMLPGNQIIIQGPGNPENINRQLQNGVNMLPSNTNQVNMMQNQMQQQNPHLSNMVIGNNQMNSQNINARHDQNINVRHDQNINARHDQNINARHDQNINARHDQNINARHDQNISARSDQNINARSDQNINARSDQNINARHDQNTNARHDQNSNERHGQNMNVRHDQNSNERHGQNMNPTYPQNMNPNQLQNMQQMNHLSRNKVNVPMHHNHMNQNANIPPPGMGNVPPPGNFNSNTNMSNQSMSNQNMQKPQNMPSNNSKNVYQPINNQNSGQINSNQGGNQNQMHNQQQIPQNQQQINHQNHNQMIYGNYGNTHPPKYI